LDLLRNKIIPTIENIFNEKNTQNIWFQQKGAGPHFAVVVRQFLDDIFPN